MGAGLSLALLLACEVLFPLLGCLVLPWYEGFWPCLIVSCFVRFDCHFLEACSFLGRKCRGSVSVVGWELWRKGKLWLGCYCIREEPGFNYRKRKFKDRVMVTHISALFLTPKGKHCKRVFHSI